MNSSLVVHSLFVCVSSCVLFACSDDAKEPLPNSSETSSQTSTTSDQTTGGDVSEDVSGEDVLPEDTTGEDVPEHDTVDEDVPNPFAFGCPTTYGFPEDAGSMQDERVTEASGIVASRQNPDVLWLHNDSGDSARLYALATDGRALGRLQLDGVDAVDMEDIAAAPCPQNAGHCLWIADVGNNARDRSTVQVYAVREPPVDAQTPFGSTTTTTFWTFSLTYAGEPVDSEGLVMSPDGSKIYLFEKANGANARLFTHSDVLTPGEDHTLSAVATFEAPGISIEFGRAITAADLHPSGSRLLIRVYTGSYEYVVDPAQPFSLEALIATEPKLVAGGPLTEAQGESIAYDSEGVGVWTVSEGIEQAPGEMLHYYPCVPE